MDLPSFANLNEVLIGVVEAGTEADVKRLMESTLTTQSILNALRRTKRYELIPLFLPLFDLSYHPERREDFDTLYAQAVVERNLEGLAELRKHLKRYINQRNIAFHYGRLSISIQPRVEGEHDYTEFFEFQEGLVSVGNCNLVSFFDDHSDRKRLCEVAGEYCAKNSMDHFGYGESELRAYLQGALLAECYDTFRHLREITTDRDFLHEQVKKVTLKNMRHFGREIIPFLLWLLKEGYLSFTDVEWAKIAKEYPLLFASLQPDV